MLKGLYLGAELYQVGEILDRLGNQSERPDSRGGGRVYRDDNTAIKPKLTHTFTQKATYYKYSELLTILIHKYCD